ncbi:MAG TPA: hypothetical protein PLV68_04300 [Ilumatobacteraceae bacterium]|nr:hypothetical protein [Ilumatobacteraceae bacterium]
MFLAQEPRSLTTWNSIVESDDPAACLYKRMRTNSAFIAKGQFVHDLALRIENGDAFECPAYLADAIAAALDR